MIIGAVPFSAKENRMKKIGKFLSSMGFAVTLLVLLAAACALCSLVEQGLPPEMYEARYGKQAASVLIALQVNDAYHSVWFIALTGFLCLNLTLCSILRFSSFRKRWKAERDPGSQTDSAGDLGETETEQPEKVFSAMGMPQPVRCRRKDGSETLYASRNSIGVWGAWVCHIGVLLLILGFALGQMTQQEAVLEGTIGETVPVSGTAMEVTIDDFRVETREDGSIAQYVTELTFKEPASGRTEQASVSVNHPASFGGYSFCQNNMGWPVTAVVTRDGKEIQRRELLPQSAMGLEDRPEYAFYYAGIDIHKAEGEKTKYTYYYDLYYNRQLVRNYYFFGEGTVELGGDRITFTPRPYTLLVLRRDRFAPLALLGGLVTLIGLFLALYLQPKALWAVRQENGKWILRGRCRKGAVLMREQMEEALRASGRKL